MSIRKKSIVIRLAIVVIALVFAVVLGSVFSEASTPQDEYVVGEASFELPSLADSFASRFMFGNIYSTPANMNTNTQAWYKHHFNAITAENAQKVANLLMNNANGWNYSWSLSDSIVNWAETNDIAMVGHTLVWHSQSRAWLAASGGAPLTRQQAMLNMETHIKNTAGRYSGRIYSWDVLNEVISSSVNQNVWNANPDWRAHLRNPGTNETRWFDAFANGASAGEHGSDFIYYAFMYARMYDPFAILYYNDYNEEQPGKRNAICQMITAMNIRWANDTVNNYEAVPVGQVYNGRLLIEGMGMQSHYHLNGWATNWENVLQALQAYINLGVRVSITELDITVWGYGTTGSPIDSHQALLDMQAFRYAQLFGYYLQYANNIERVSLWGKTDNQSWRSAGNGQPFGSPAVGFPLIFDNNYEPKPAFHSIINSLATTQHASNISVPVVTGNVRFSSGETGNAIVIEKTGTPFAVQLIATQNNFAPIQWSVDEGSLPPGLRLVSATGVILGTPTTDGIYTFSVCAANSLGGGTNNFTIKIGDVEDVCTCKDNECTDNDCCESCDCIPPVLNGWSVDGKTVVSEVWQPGVLYYFDNGKLLTNTWAGNDEVGIRYFGEDGRMYIDKIYAMQIDDWISEADQEDILDMLLIKFDETGARDGMFVTGENATGLFEFNGKPVYFVGGFAYKEWVIASGGNIAYNFVEEQRAAVGATRIKNPWYGLNPGEWGGDESEYLWLFFDGEGHRLHYYSLAETTDYQAVSGTWLYMGTHPDILLRHTPAPYPNPSL